ncbi:hypothetical protein E2562_028397, partial [Oryza meyeriana var. granulata]
IIVLCAGGVLIEGQAQSLGEDVVPTTNNDETVVFTAYFDTGFRFPYYNLLPEVLACFKLELP